MTGGMLLRFRLRRERVVLPVWLLGTAALLAASGGAIAQEFGDEQARSAVVVLAAGNPAFLFLRGLPDGTGVGALVFFQTFAFLAVLAGLMNTFLVTRHTRADEERGRDELLQATPVSRTALLSSALGVALAANIAMAALVTAAGVLVGFDPWPASLTGLALAAVGLCFAGSTALVAQVMPSPRGVNGVAAALVGIAYLVRGIGDALGTATEPTRVEPSWLSFLSPIGWAQAARPFSTADPLPLLVPVLTGALAAALALRIRRRRDLGASLVLEPLGRPEWPRAGATSLAIRNQRGTAIGWAVGTGTLGLLAGLLTPLVAEAVAANDELAALIARLAPGVAADTGELFAIALLGLAATLATAAGVQCVTRLRVDEAEDRAELLLVAGVSRIGWVLRQLGVALAATVLVAVVGGLAAGLGFIANGEPLERFGTALAAILVHLPAGAVFVALTLLAFAVAPRWTFGIGWELLTLGLVVGQLGDLLGLPAAVQALSPFHHVPAVPLERVDPVPLLVSAAAAIVVTALALVAFRRRDVPA